MSYLQVIHQASLFRNENQDLQGQYEAAHDSSDNWCGSKYRARSAADIRLAWNAKAGDNRCGNIHRYRSDSRHAHRNEARLLQAPCAEKILGKYQEHLQAGYAEYPYAVSLHLLYLRTEYDTCHILGPGSDSPRSLLQMAELLLYPAGRVADLHRPHDKLQLRSAEHQALPQYPVGLLHRRRCSDGHGNTVLPVHSVTDDTFFLPRQRSSENRRSRLPRNRTQLCSNGYITAVSCVLSGSGKSLQKLSPHRDTDCFSVRSAGLAVRQIRTVLLLADIPHNRDNNISRGICYVQQIRQE